MSKAIKIGQDLETFLNEHPEIKITRNSEGKIKAIFIPEEADLIYISYSSQSLYEIKYIYKGELNKYPVN